jgi:8-oxo-dGTP pyrophosphatase MutT (NUDIX family)
MSRNTKLVGLSMPQNTYKKVEKLIKQKDKTRSEFYREMIDVYLTTLEKDVYELPQTEIPVKEKDLAKILRSYWHLKSKSPLKTIVIGLGIIVNNKSQVLIGARKSEDKWVENLTWVFPGGKMDSLEFTSELKKEIKQETGLDVVVKSIIASRTHPDSGYKSVEIVALYFHCISQGNSKPKPGGDLEKLEWVKPTEVFKYFTTSTCDDVTKFLMTTEKGS